VKLDIHIDINGMEKLIVVYWICYWC